ncbi:MAG: GcrA family cell cycle regulator, partial [Alphaproteobacteria bacterium]
WPAQRVEELLKLWREGVPVKEIARRFEVTVPAVESKVVRLRSAGYRLARRRAGPPATRAQRLRRCLYCGERFMSEHIGNRLCPACLENGPFTSAMV